jgi:hypothetical protein
VPKHSLHSHGETFPSKAELGAFSVQVFTFELVHCAFPPIPQNTRKGWDTQSTVKFLHLVAAQVLVVQTLEPAPQLLRGGAFRRP